MVTLLDRRLGQLQRRRRLARIVAGLLPPIALTTCVSACAIVLLRLSAPGLAWLAWPLVLAGVLAPLVLLPRAWARADSPAMLAGHLDRLTGAEGLVMALAAESAAARDEAWSERVRRPLEDLRWPPLRWPRWPLAALGLLAALGAALLPQRLPPPPAPAAAWASLVSTSAQRVETLAEAGLLPEAQRQELERQLERLHATASGQGMSEAVWAGLDRVDRSAAEHAERASLRLAEALVQAERAAGVQPTLSQAQAELQQLARHLAELQQLAPGLAPQLPQLPPGAAEALQEALRHAAAGSALSPQQLAALQQLGLDPSSLPAGAFDREAARRAAGALAQQLERYGQQLDRLGLREAFERGRGLPDRGGVTRGPGHGALELSNQGRAEAGGLDGLPAGARLNPDGSVTLAESRREADLDPAALRDLQRASRRAFDPTAADARRAEVAPRHRQAVAAYFGSDPQTPDGDRTP